MAAPAACSRSAAALLVEIETDGGVIGIGEAGLGGGSAAHVIERQLKPLILGEDPLLIEGLWQKMFARTRQFGRRGIVMNAMSGIDIALWDIAGKIAKLPLYRLFGALRRPGRGLCQRRLLPGRQIGRRSRRRGRGLPRPRLQGHEDEDRPQPVDPDASAPPRRQCEALRGRARGGHRPCRRGAPGAGAKGQIDGRRQLRLEPGDGDRDRPRARALQALLDRGAGGDRRHRRQRAGGRSARHPDRRLRDRDRPLRLSRADHPRRGRHRSARPRLVRRLFRVPPHRRPGAGASPHGGAARLRRRGPARRLAAFRGLDTERTGARIRPEPERATRRIAEGAACLESDGTVRLPQRPGLGIELDPAAVERYRVA